MFHFSARSGSSAKVWSSSRLVAQGLKKELIDGIHLGPNALNLVLADVVMCNTVKPVLAVTSFKQPTCLKQPNKMFPNVKFVLIFTSVKQPPALSSHFLCFPCVAA